MALGEGLLTGLLVTWLLWTMTEEDTAVPCTMTEGLAWPYVMTEDPPISGLWPLWGALVLPPLALSVSDVSLSLLLPSV